jgi:hypothetical protein
MDKTVHECESGWQKTCNKDIIIIQFQLKPIILKHNVILIKTEIQVLLW